MESDHPWPVTAGPLASVDTDELVQGCVKHLSDQGDVKAVLGSYEDTNVPFLFQHTLWINVEGSRSTAAVISRAGGWAAPNTFNTMEFPRLGLEIYVDPHRDADRNVTDPGEAQRRIEATFQVFDRHLHITSGEQYWGTVRVIGSTRIAEPNVYAVPDGDGLLRLIVFYGVVEA